MKKRFYILIILFLFLVTNVSFVDNFKNYTVKEGDTLASIAIAVYGEFSKSEQNREDNRYRWILIYQANQEKLGLTMEIDDYGADPVIQLNSDQEIIIPILEEYPSIDKLKVKIAVEINNVKKNLRQSNESTRLSQLANQTTDQISMMNFSEDDNGDLTIKQISYQISPLILKNGTLVPPTDAHENDIFIWQIIEHPQAEKTIFIFPTTHTDLSAGYKKFLAMNTIYNLNTQPVYVLLESIDQNDDSLITQFVNIKQTNKFYNFSQILTQPHFFYRNTQKMQPAMNACMALFYEKPNITLQGIENKIEIDRYLAAEKKIQEQVDNKFEKYQGSQLRNFYRYFYIRTDYFLLSVEDNIIESAKSNKITGKNQVDQINSLQTEFAKLYLAEDFLDNVLLKYEDNRVENILAAIDKICGSNTTALYKSYKTDILLNRKQMVSSELNIILMDYKQYLNTDLNSEALSKRNSVIAQAFASLPDGSIGICELGLEHLYNQLSLCLEKGAYNLVMYHHPSIKYAATGYAEPQDPQEHKEQLDKYIIDDTYFNDLIMPTIFKKTYENDSNSRVLIQRAYLLFKNRDFSLEDNFLQNGQSTIYFWDIAGTGGLLRLARYNDNTLSIRYLFIPGNTVEKINENLEKIVAEENFNTQEKKLLIHFGQVVEAGKDI